MTDAIESTLRKAITTIKETKSGSTKKGKEKTLPLSGSMRESRLKGLRGETLAWIRIIIKQADPEVVEERKWVFRSGRTPESSVPVRRTKMS